MGPAELMTLQNRKRRGIVWALGPCGFKQRHSVFRAESGVGDPPPSLRDKAMVPAAATGKKSSIPGSCMNLSITLTSSFSWTNGYRTNAASFLFVLFLYYFYVLYCLIHFSSLRSFLFISSFFWNFLLTSVHRLCLMFLSLSGRTKMKSVVQLPP